MTQRACDDDCTANAVDVLVEKWKRPSDGDTQEIMREAMVAYHETHCCSTHGTHAIPHVRCILR
jgi:hypothetical protein